MNGSLLKVYGPKRFLRSTTPLCRMSSGSSDATQSPTTATTGQTATIPEEPTTCCMSGCANCVWIDYANQLCKIFNDDGEKSKEIILSKVTDPNMKAFLLMELKALENSTNKAS
uniref:Oxidoreductase-like domain-containing protein n=1 Tax=Graphocephala atropunctata TaxID=36148 RepID=A0A1B6MMX1_9HEMI